MRMLLLGVVHQSCHDGDGDAEFHLHHLAAEAGQDLVPCLHCQPV
jgi:hypothetical protein